MKAILLAAITVATLPAAAYAQAGDTALYAGPRVELHGGWNRINGDLYATDGVNSASASTAKSGGVYGVQVGYDAAFGRGVLLGAFASYDLSSTKDCGFVDVDLKACLKAERNIEAGARVGTTIIPQMLIYAKGAYVNGRFRASESDFEGDYASGHTTRGGWRVGAGTEFAMGHHAYLKAEYNYSRYARYTEVSDDIETSLRLDRQEVLGGVGLRF